MPRRAFRTIPEELLELAELVISHFRRLGYTVHVERQELGFPSTPALTCTRQRTKVVVEVDSTIRKQRLEEWAAYGRSAGQDFRVVLCVMASAEVPKGWELYLKGIGVGCLLCEGSSLEERVSPTDLGLNVTLPEIRTLPKKVRESLGPAYEQFDKALWREGFETACQSFEAEARRYLKRNRARLLVNTKSGPQPLRPSAIDKMTMGQLAATFARLVNQNHSDSTIGRTLGAVNKDRIGVAHHKSRKTTERRLRANVGRHMWSLVSGLKLAIE